MNANTIQSIVKKLFQYVRYYLMGKSEKFRRQCLLVDPHSRITGVVIMHLFI